MTTYDATNPKHVSIANRSTKADQDAQDAFLNHTMGMVDGRRFIHSLLVRCHVFENPFGGDAWRTAFLCGEQNVGQRVWADIMRVCPDEYVQMMREANARIAADDTRRSRSDADSDWDNIGPEPYTHPAFDGIQATNGSSSGGAEVDYSPIERDAEGEGTD